MWEKKRGGEEICSRGPRDPYPLVGRSFVTRRAFSMHHGKIQSLRNHVLLHEKLISRDAIYHSFSAHVRVRAQDPNSSSTSISRRFLSNRNRESQLATRNVTFAYSIRIFTRVRSLDNFVIVGTVAVTSIQTAVDKRRYNLPFDINMRARGTRYFRTELKLRPHYALV